MHTAPSFQLHAALPGFISEDDAAAKLGLKVSTLRVWAARRMGPPRTKVGKQILYRETALLEWVQAQERRYDALPKRGATA